MSSSNRSSLHQDADGLKRLSKASSDARQVEEAISNPGAVKINVQGAFIVDDESQSRSPVEGEGVVRRESQDIRLPHHTGVVSHVAVDVSLFFFVPRTISYPPQSAAAASARRC